MKKIIYFSFLISAVSFTACVDRDKVDGNPTDGVFNGGRPSDPTNNTDNQSANDSTLVPNDKTSTPDPHKNN